MINDEILSAIMCHREDPAIQCYSPFSWSFDIYLTYIWHIFDIYLTYIWHIFDIYLTYIWHIVDIYLTYIWHIFDILSPDFRSLILIPPVSLATHQTVPQGSCPTTKKPTGPGQTANFSWGCNHKEPGLKHQQKCEFNHYMGLVVGPPGHPSEKYDSQLGWWNSQYMGKI